VLVTSAELPARGGDRPCPAETGDQRVRGRARADGQLGGSEQVAPPLCEKKKYQGRPPFRVAPMHARTLAMDSLMISGFYSFMHGFIPR